MVASDCWVLCKGTWVEGATVSCHPHDYRLIKILQRCCFEHGVGRVLMASPSQYSLEGPGRPLAQVPDSLPKVPRLPCWLSAAE